MSKRIAPALIVSLGTCLACASHDDSSGEFRQALADTRAENDNHAAFCVQAKSMATMSAEMERHEQAMPPLFRRLDTGFSEMGHCYRGDPAALRNKISGLRSGDNAHFARMQEAQNLADSAAECRSYTDTVRRDLEQMEGMMDTSVMGCMM